MVLGASFKKKADTLEGFLVARREVGEWLLAFTYGATYFSSVVIVVGGSWAYKWGLPSLLIPLANVALGALLAFVVVGEGVSKLSTEFRALTVPELLAKYYDAPSLQKVLGVICFVGLTLYSTTVILSAATMLKEVLRTGFVASSILISMVMAVYVSMSEMYGVVWTDLLQGMVMAVCLPLLAIEALMQVGGIDGLVKSTPPSKLVVDLPHALTIIDLALLTSVAVWGLLQMLNRFYIAHSVSVVRRSTGFVTVFAFVVVFSAFLSGMAATVLLKPVEPIMVIPKLSSYLLGSVGTALLSAAVIAASMSTVDSVALTAASALIYDVLGIKSTRYLRIACSMQLLAASAIAIMVTKAPKGFPKLSQQYSGWGGA